MQPLSAPLFFFCPLTSVIFRRASPLPSQRVAVVAIAVVAFAIAAAIGTVSYTVLALTTQDVRKKYRPFRFSAVSRTVARSLAKLSWPEVVRGIGLMAGFLLFQRIHSHLGTRELAAGTILVQVASVGFLPALGFGLAGATFVGRALGQGRSEEARAMIWQTMRIALVILLVPALVLQVVPGPVLSIFTPDGVVIALATPAMRVLSASFLMDAVSFTIVYSLLGGGATRWAAKVQLTSQYLILLPLSWLFGVTMSWGVTGLWLGMLASRGALAALALRKIRGDDWTQIDV